MMKHKSVNVPFLLMFMLLVLVVSACDGIGIQEEPTPEPIEVEDFTPIVSATGIVLPMEWVVLSMETSGVVEEVLVEQDDLVAEDQVLIRLEGKENLQAAISAAEFEVVASRRALDQLFEDPEIRTAEALQTVAEAQQVVDDAQRDLDNLLAKSKIVDIDQARANVILARDKLNEAQEDFEPYENKPETNLTRAALLSKLAQTQKEYDALVRYLNNLLGTANSLDVAEAEADLQLAQAQLLTAQRDYENLAGAPDPQDVAVAEARLENAAIQLAAAKATLSDLELQSPIAGIIIELNVKRGEWVVPGQPLITIANLNDLYVETTDLSEIDVAQVNIGDSVIVTFDALPEVETLGTVTRIANRSAAGSGVNYTVELELQEIPEQLRWGMTAFVDIEIGRQQGNKPHRE